MKKDEELPELIFGTSEKKENVAINRLLRKGKLRKIAPRVYTSDMSGNPSEIIKKNILIILGRLFPGALMSHRSALEYRPTSEGYIFITYPYTKKIVLPGVIVRFMEGRGPVSGDIKLHGSLHASQLERALL